MRKLVLVTFLLCGTLAFSQEKTEKVKEETKTEKTAKGDCECTCNHEVNLYDELKRVQEMYNSSLINLREYEKIRKKIIKKIKKKEYGS